MKILLIFLWQVSNITNPGFFEDSVMSDYSEIHIEDGSKIEYKRYGKSELRLNEITQNLEVIKVYLNKENHEIIDSCTYALWFIYQRTEEADDGSSYKISQKVRLEYAKFNPLKNNLFYEKYDKLEKEKWTIKSTKVNTCNIYHLRELTTGIHSSIDYHVVKETNILPHYSASWHSY